MRRGTACGRSARSRPSRSGSEGTPSRRRRAKSRLLGAAGALWLTASAARADEPESHFDFGWDEGPTYELYQSSGPLGLVRDVRLRGRIGGSLFLDGGYLAGSAFEDDEWATAVRRARLYTAGVFTLGAPTSYKFEFAIEGKHVYLNDFYLRWDFSRWIDSIQVGYFDPPVSLEALESTRDRGLMETPPAVSAFAPGMRIGAQVAGSSEDPPLSWALSLSSVGQRPNDADASSSPLRATGRLVWHPLLEAEDAEPTLLHVGLSLRYQIAGSGSVEFRSRPESFLSDYLVDTDELDGPFYTVGAELAGQRGPVLLQAEYLRTQVDWEDHYSLSFYGLYGQARWVVTGEVRPYDEKRAIFGRVNPAAPLSWERGQWGALELTARAGWLDLSNRGVRGGRMLSVDVGPAWTANDHLRLLLGYVFARITDRPESSGNAHIVQGRIELWF